MEELKYIQSMQDFRLLPQSSQGLCFSAGMFDGTRW